MGADACAVPSVKQVAGANLPYRAGRSAQGSVVTQRGGVWRRKAL